MLQKIHRRFLLKAKAAVHRTAGINQQSKLNGQVGFTPEVDDSFGRFVVVQVSEISLVQIADKLAMLVGGNEKYVHFIHALADG